MRKRGRRLWFYLVVVAMVVLCIFPIYWMITTSFKAPGDVLKMPPLWAFEPTFENYVDAFAHAPLLKQVGNSLLVSIVSTVLVLLVSLPAAYSFGRFNTGGGHLMFFILSTRMFPAVAVAVPYFMIFRTFNLLDTPWALIAAYTMFNFSFATVLLYGFFKEIPVELEHSAMVDGYTRVQIMRRIILPLVAPGVAVTAIFCLLFAWNEFLFGFLLTRDAAKTITVGVSGFWTQRGILWGPLSAVATICVLPMLLAVVFLQRYIVRGLTFGAVRR